MLDRTLTTPIIYITTNLTKDLNRNTLKLEIQIFESYLTHDAFKLKHVHELEKSTIEHCKAFLIKLQEALEL